MARTAGITEVGTVFVPVTDQERSLAFFVDVLGFEKRADFPYGHGSRWVEVAPPGAANSISLVPPTEGTAVRTDTAHCAFVTSDIEHAHASLTTAGAEVEDVAGPGSRRRGLVSPEVGISDPVPRQFLFRDPDGNRFLVVQPG